MVMCSMMQWLHSLRLHNFYETAARLKSADSAVVGNNDLPPSQPVDITAPPPTDPDPTRTGPGPDSDPNLTGPDPTGAGPDSAGDTDCNGKDGLDLQVQTDHHKLEPHPLQSESISSS